MKFTIRDILWLAIVVAICLLWSLDRRSLAVAKAELKAQHLETERLKQASSFETDNYRAKQLADEKKLQRRLKEVAADEAEQNEGWAKLERSRAEFVQFKTEETARLYNSKLAADAQRARLDELFDEQEKRMNEYGKKISRRIDEDLKRSVKSNERFVPAAKAQP